MPNGYTHDKNPDTIDEKELFELLMKDLDTHFGLFMQKYAGLCYSKAMSLTHHSQDAEDITQTAFLKAYKGLQALQKKKSEVENLKAWLLKIVSNEFMNLRSGKEAKLPVVLVSEGDEFEDDSKDRPENVVETAERYERFTRTMERLPQKDQEMIRLNYIENMSVAEIRTTYYPDIPLNTLKSCLRRATQKLRRIWANDTDEEGK